MMRCVVGGHPWSVQELGWAELVPMSVGRPLQDLAGACVYIK